MLCISNNQFDGCFAFDSINDQFSFDLHLNKHALQNLIINFPSMLAIIQTKRKIIKKVVGSEWMTHFIFQTALFHQLCGVCLFINQINTRKRESHKSLHFATFFSFAFQFFPTLKREGDNFANNVLSRGN